jgi:hypothetical protein
MENRIEIGGEPISIELKETATGFRLELLPLTDASSTVKETLFERAAAWSRLVDGNHGGVGIHCFREGGAIVVESLTEQATANELDYLVTQLKQPLGRRAAAAVDPDAGKQNSPSETLQHVGTGP